MIKLYHDFVPQAESLKELLVAWKLVDMGLEIPKAYRLVTDGKRFGVEFELIRNKKSFARAISNEPVFLGFKKSPYKTEQESALKIPTGNTFAAGMIPQDVFAKLAEKAPGLNLQTRILTISDKRIFHALRSNHDAIPKDTLKRLPEIISSWECTYDESKGLCFWSPLNDSNDEKRYIVVFKPDSSRGNHLSFTTGYKTNKKAFRKKDAL